MSIRWRLAIASISTLRVRGARAIGKDGWVAILRATGLDEAAMHRWHIEFERMAPDAHQDFLESLGLSKAEITRIRHWSRPGKRRSSTSLSESAPSGHTRRITIQRLEKNRLHESGATSHAAPRPRRT